MKEELQDFEAMNVNAKERLLVLIKFQRLSNVVN